MSQEFLLWKDRSSTYDFDDKIQMISRHSSREVKAVLRLKKNARDLRTLEKCTVAHVSDQEYEAIEPLF